MAAVVAAGLAAGYPRAADAATANNVISRTASSTDTADLDGFGLNRRRLIAAGEGNSFSPRNRKENAGSRESHRELQFHDFTPRFKQTFPGLRHINID